MKNKIDLTFNFFVPLLEIIYEENVRKHLEFLKTSEKLCKKLEQLHFQRKSFNKKNIAKLTNDVLFVPRIGNLKLALTTETYHYYRTTRPFVCDKEPIRPLIAFVTNYIKWKDRKNAPKSSNSRKRAEIYLSLMGSVQKKTTLEVSNKKEDVNQKIDKIIKECNNQKSREKRDLLEAVFTDYSKFHVRESDLLTIIEAYSEIHKVVDFNLKNKKRLVFDNMEIFFLDFNKILLIKRRNHTNLFTKRIIQVLQLVFFLKVLANRSNEILDKQLINNRHIDVKFEFFEYLLSVLDPQSYSSVDNFKILPKHYQRILFKKTIEILTYNKYSEKIKEKLTEQIKSWELREQVMFLSRNNSIINRLSVKYRLERNQIVEPLLTEKERVMMDFLLNKYQESVIKLGPTETNIRTRIPVGSLSANKIRQEINPWMTKRRIETNLITDNELKKSPPKVIIDLNLKGLVNIKEPEKPNRISYLYSINEKDEYIKARIRGL